MKYLLALVLSALCFSSLPLLENVDFHSGLLDLGSGNTAKQLCSCRFVMNRDKKFCRKFTKAVPLLDFLDWTSTDEEEKKVTAYIGVFLPFNKRVAQYQSQELGCTLI